MADYATVTDATNMYGIDYVTVCMDRNRDGAIDTTVRDAAFARATSVINGELAGRLPLPLSPVPEDIKAYCVDLALYYASVMCDVATTQKRQLRDDAMEALKRMAKNARSLGVEAPDTNTSATASINSEDREFDRTELGKLF